MDVPGQCCTTEGYYREPAIMRFPPSAAEERKKQKRKNTTFCAGELVFTHQPFAVDVVTALKSKNVPRVSASEPDDIESTRV